jgi:hypothetical protein
MADFGCGFSLTGAEMGMESIDFTISRAHPAATLLRSRG